MKGLKSFALRLLESIEIPPGMTPLAPTVQYVGFDTARVFALYPVVVPTRGPTAVPPRPSPIVPRRPGESNVCSQTPCNSGL